MAGPLRQPPSAKNRKRNRAPTKQLNLNVRGLPRSATIAINERCEQLRKQGKEIFKMGLGQSPFPVPEPVVAALRANAHQKDYLPVKGLPRLRRAIAGQHQQMFDIDYRSEDVLIGPGSKELMFILQLVYYGDLVIPTPAWVSYAPQALIIGRHVKFLPTIRENRWRITAAQLDALCRSDPQRPRILILNYPSNPTGATYGADDLAEIAAVARKYKVILLSDEIYGRLHHDGKHQSIVPLYPEGTIFSGGLSKWCGAGGWRLGIFVFPRGLQWLAESMAVVASETFTSTSAPIQYAAVEAFRENAEIDNYLQQSRRILKVLGNILADTMEAGGLQLLHPEGGFYLFPDMTSFSEKLHADGITTSSKLCERLLNETGVAVLPGSDFGRPPEELTARLAYVNFDGGSSLEAADNVPRDRGLDEAFVRRYCPEPLQAVERLCAWLNAR